MGRGPAGRFRAPAARGPAGRGALLKSVLAAALACGAIAATAAATAAIAPFSSAAPGGAPPAGWRALSLPRALPGEASLVADGGRTVLRLRAQGAVASMSHAVDLDPAAQPRLAWRWKVERVVANADLTRKDGDDFAARVYVTFDLPLESLPFATRARIRMGRLLFGEELPAAALCYVWDNRHPVGTTAWNAYSDRVRMVVLRSGGARAGEWVDESRDVARDFRAAFGVAPPRVSGIVVSVDTDQTGEDVAAWFGDLAFGPRA